MFGPILMISIALILFFVILNGLGKAIESRRWPKTNGRVIYNKVHQFNTLNPIGEDLWYRPDSDLVVEYEYKVCGKKYRCSNIKFLRGNTNNFFLEKRAGRKYPLNSRVLVSYNPRSPLEACLEPGVGAAAIVGLGIPMFFFFGGVAFLVVQ